ncbi:MAG TPA: VWA domain-containing protein [Gemmatimonadaceae bacterium]|nr:VWA domain-containing protein [Gemmatimonadaceae bacterium]
MRLHRFLRNRAIRLTRRFASPVHRWRGARSASLLPLEAVRRRLELTIAAMYGVPLSVNAMGAATADVVLPPRLAIRGDVDDAIARYRVLALAQAARLARGAAAQVPAHDAIAHDLFLITESAAAERDVVARAPKLASALGALRFAELTARPKIFRLAHAERHVESLLRAVLASPADTVPEGVAACASPAESRAWAEATAREIRRASGDRATYRPLNPMTLWGLAWPARRGTDDVNLGGGGGGSTPDPYASMQPDDDAGTRRGERESSSGREETSGDDASAEDSGERAGVADGGAAATDNAHSTHDGEHSMADAPRDERKTAADRPPPGGIPYPEWDEYAHRVREHGATVSCSVAADGDATWAEAILREHAPLVREVRDRFAPLRAQRLRLRRQRSGDELDLDACVEALVDRQMGRAPSDRLYQVVRPGRQSVAFALLVDASGSTATRLADGRTVLDVERMTLLLAGEALASLGDPYAMLAFSGSRRHGVQMRTIKGFAEHDPSAVHRRIAALAPQDNTRLGAAVRHATAVLRAQPAQRRVLLLLSDGQPNDVDFYQGSYAIEDSRRALNEARVDGVVPFCLTVEQDERDYLPHLFGQTGYRVLSRPEQLPAALLAVVRGMLAGA